MKLTIYIIQFLSALFAGTVVGIVGQSCQAEKSSTYREITTECIAGFTDAVKNMNLCNDALETCVTTLRLCVDGRKSDE